MNLTDESLEMFGDQYAYSRTFYFVSAARPETFVTIVLRVDELTVPGKYIGFSEDNNVHVEFIAEYYAMFKFCSVIADLCVPMYMEGIKLVLYGELSL